MEDVRHRQTMITDGTGFECTCGLTESFGSVYECEQAMFHHHDLFVPEEEGVYKESYGSLGEFLNGMRTQIDHIEGMVQELGDRLLPSEARGDLFLKSDG